MINEPLHWLEGRPAEQVWLDDKHGACRELTFWGLSDRHTWIAEHFGPDRAPLLFDKELQSKPAYDGVALALNNRAKREARTP